MTTKGSMENKLPQRKSPRAQWLEYNEGMYFVTVCTKGRLHSFGEIRDGKMEMTKIGDFLNATLKNASLRQSYAKVLQYVVMPNHFHAIIDIVGTRHAVSATEPPINMLCQKNADMDADTACRVPTREERIEKGLKCHRLPLLSTFIGSLKSAVTKYAHECGQEFVWQPRFHDHAIRGVEDGNNISAYIENNVANWEKDCFF